MLRKIMFYIFGIMTLLSLVGCGLWNKPLKILRMSEGICEPPCWMGITPLKTSFEESIDILQELEYFTEDGHIKIEEDMAYISWYGGGGNNAYIHFSGEIVYSIRFYAKNTKLGHVIKTYGPPEYYTSQEGGSEYGIDIFYPQLGMVFDGFGVDPLSEDTVMDSVYFIQPRTAENFITDYIDFRKSLHPMLIYEKEYYPWQGLGVCPQGLSSDYYLCQE